MYPLQPYIIEDLFAAESRLRPGQPRERSQGAEPIERTRVRVHMLVFRTVADLRKRGGIVPWRRAEHSDRAR